MNTPFGKLMEQAKNFQDALKTIRVVGESGAGMVKVEMDGHHHILKIIIDDEIYKEDKAVVLDLITAAINNAADNVGRAIKDKMAQLATGFGLPANFTFPFM